MLADDSMNLLLDIEPSWSLFGEKQSELSIMQWNDEW